MREKLFLPLRSFWTRTEAVDRNNEATPECTMIMHRSINENATKTSSKMSSEVGHSSDDRAGC